jgi:hypothetical protein
MMKKRTYFLGVMGFVCAFALYGQAGGKLGMAAGLTDADLKKLIDAPAIISSTAKELPKNEDGKLYYETTCDVHVVSSQPIEKVYGVITDLPNYPKYFSGSKKVEVIRTVPEGKVVKATAGSVVLSLSYVYVMKEPVNSASEHYIDKVGINEESDERMQDMRTEYYLKTITLDGKSYTYIRTRDAADYLSGIVGSYMKNNNDKSQKDGLTALIKAASKK